MACKGGVIGLGCGAVVGGTAGGAAGGAVGAATGGICGAAGGAAGGAVAGVPLALVTFGLSVPVGAAFGAMCGGTVGATTLCKVGQVVGGIAGFTWGGSAGSIVGAGIGYYRARRKHLDPLPLHPENLLKRTSDCAMDAALHEELFCPIGLEIMRDPVTDSLGYTYERAMIQEWFDHGHDTSPIANVQLPNQLLVPNHALRTVIMLADDEEWHRANAMSSAVADIDHDDELVATN